MRGSPSESQHGGLVRGYSGSAMASAAYSRPVGVGCARVLGDEQQDAPIRCLENGQETPRAVEIQPANDRELFSCQPYTRGRAAAPAYVLDG